jgi:phytoene dehydrogenase-like protein
MAKIVIVGGGVAGLSAAIFARLNGFETEIYESNEKVGGECISWKRGEYTFDGSVQWLMGTSQKTELNKMWQKLGAFDNSKVKVDEVFLTVEHKGEKIFLYRDIKKTEKHWREKFPEDKKLIDEFFGYAKKAKGFSLPVNKNMTEMNVFDYLKMGPKMMGMGGLMMKYGKVEGQDYFNRFSSVMIRNALKTLALPVYPAYSAASIMGALYDNDGGWPLGGSSAMTENMKNRLEKLGGTVFTMSPVERIIVEDGIAAGIELKSGKRVKADYVISATDISVTLNKLLDGQYKDEPFNDILSGGNNGQYQFGTCVYVGLGIGEDLSEYDSPLVTTLDEPVKIGNELIEDIHFTTYCNMEGYSPKGKSVIKTVIQLYDYSYWSELYNNKENYMKVKEKIAQAVIKRVESVYPKAAGKIEVINIATPVTYNRYCGAYRGAWMGYAANTKAKYTNHSCTLKGISNFALAGQWLSTPGGLPIAAATGKFAVQKVCEDLKVTFHE